MLFYFSSRKITPRSLVQRCLMDTIDEDDINKLAGWTPVEKDLLREELKKDEERRKEDKQRDLDQYRPDEGDGL